MNAETKDAARIMAVQARAAHDAVSAAIRVDAELWRRKKDALADFLEELKTEEAAMAGRTIDGVKV